MILLKVPCIRLSVLRKTVELKSVLSGHFQANSWWASIRVISLGLRGGLGVSAGVKSYHVIFNSLLATSHVAACKSQPLLVRTSYRSHDKEIRFDWSMLWRYVSPDLFLLSVAIVVSYGILKLMTCHCK